MLNWLFSQSLIEILGVITGLVCVYLAAINNIWNWLIGIINLLLYGYIFFQARLYSDMLLQVYFLVTSIYGWYFWIKKDVNQNKEQIKSITKKQITFSIVFVIMFTLLLGEILIHYTNASYPFIDSFCTACSFVAQFFLAKKIIENWLIWLFVDIIYIVIYTCKHLELTAIMYFIYMLIVIKGYKDWKKEMSISLN